LQFELSEERLLTSNMLPVLQHRSHGASAEYSILAAAGRVGQAIVLLALLPLCCSNDDNNPSLRGGTPMLEQVLVFDAGSSGTRVHIFNMYPAQKGAHIPTIELSVRDKQTRKVKPGLSDFAKRQDLDGAQQNIERLLEFAGQFVPHQRRASTPVLLKATAGLRAVEARLADAVLKRVRQTVKASGYLFRDEWADIIRGKEEGGLAWVAANYLRGTFNDDAEMEPVGVIELGGGSAQVTFQVDSTEHVVDKDAFTFTTLLGKEFRLYAHSYLGYGQDHAQARLRTVVEASGASSAEAADMKDPCYPAGYLRPGSSPGAAGSTGVSLLVQGSGDAVSCQDLIQSHLFKDSEIAAPGHYASELPIRGELVATENFFYARNSLSLPLQATPSAMQEAAKYACGQSKTPAPVELENMKKGVADPGKPNECFGLSYQAALLDALKVPRTVGVKVQIMRQINGGDVDWALGAALMHVIGKKSRISMAVGDDEAFRILVIVGLLLAGLLMSAWAVRCCRRPILNALAGSKMVQATTLGASSKVSPAE